MVDGCLFSVTTVHFRESRLLRGSLSIWKVIYEALQYHHIVDFFAIDVKRVYPVSFFAKSCENS